MKFARGPLISIVLVAATLLVADWKGASGASHPIAQATPEATPFAQSDQDAQVSLPDLITLPLTELRLVQIGSEGRRVIRFANSIGNIGRGPLEVIGEAGPDGLEYQVRQRIYTSTGQLAIEPLLTAIDYHSEHAHWHLDDFARYELWSTHPYGGLNEKLTDSGKVSYCLMDTDKGEQGPDVPRGYVLCGPTKQGLSAGWVDTYRSHVPGQFLEVSDLPGGVYAIRSVVDPSNHLRESNEDNNAVVSYFLLTRDTVEPISPPEELLSRPHLRGLDPGVQPD